MQSENQLELSKLIQRIIDETEVFPEEDLPGCGYWHMHLPTAQSFIDGPKTPKHVRRSCVQTLIDRVVQLCNLKPSDSFTRVVAAIALPRLWDSQIIVFFDPEYFGRFFCRDSPEQRWVRLSEDRSVVKEWGLVITERLIERGYHETIRDEDYSQDGEIWFVGELHAMH